MVYISGAKKNRLGKHRFDALFDAGRGQLQQDTRDARLKGGLFPVSGRTRPWSRRAELPPAINQG
ncbi:hypothetical protein FHS26_001551 [Rhizobium pisi]|jgi:hypothetical protein|uniref:Uncharacterized protein n=2 Tax=Rhizobium TaxID=379 RepID=A0A7W6B410_9HYPH|nr:MULTISPECIES: hypothetical protein [Rhizobium]MBB3133838.1 hypothetical protein [Rhizobium pisi]MBB3915162.1 hypothetical protein [Rhizobium fabae]